MFWHWGWSGELVIENSNLVSQFRCSVTSDFATSWTAAHQSFLSITNSQSLLKLRSIDSVMPSNHLILCHPLLLLPSIFSSNRVFSHESVLPIRGPKYWSFSFSINPFSEYSGLISFRMDWLDLLAVQGTLESSPTPQFKSINSSILCISSVQLLNHVQLFATPWVAACQASLSITNSWGSLRLTSVELVMPSSHLILCHPPLLLPPIPPSIRVFSNESTLCMRWPKYN